MSGSNALSCLHLLVWVFFSSGTVAADPRTDYLLHCSGCHTTSGIGTGINGLNVPTLHNELGKMAGTPEMRDYLIRIPGASQAALNDQELADVINWILKEFNSDTMSENIKPYSGKEVGKARKNILYDPLKYRAMYWETKKQ